MNNADRILQNKRNQFCFLARVFNYFWHAPVKWDTDGDVQCNHWFKSNAIWMGQLVIVQSETVAPIWFTIVVYPLVIPTYIFINKIRTTKNETTMKNCFNLLCSIKNVRGRVTEMIRLFSATVCRFLFVVIYDTQKGHPSLMACSRYIVNKHILHVCMYIVCKVWTDAKREPEQLDPWSTGGG